MTKRNSGLILIETMFALSIALFIILAIIHMQIIALNTQQQGLKITLANITLLNIIEKLKNDKNNDQNIENSKSLEKTDNNEYQISIKNPHKNNYIVKIKWFCGLNCIWKCNDRVLKNYSCMQTTVDL